MTQLASCMTKPLESFMEAEMNKCSSNFTAARHYHRITGTRDSNILDKLSKRIIALKHKNKLVPESMQNNL